MPAFLGSQTFRTADRRRGMDALGDFACMDNRTDLGNARLQALTALCGEFKVQILYAFGSRGREVLAWVHGGDLSLGGPADIDLGVRPMPDAAWNVADKVRLAIALEDLLGCTRVDLVVLPEADPFVAAEVVRGERLVCRDSREADEYDLYVLRRAGDLMPLERERQALLLRGDA